MTGWQRPVPSAARNSPAATRFSIVFIMLIKLRGLVFVVTSSLIYRRELGGI
jgi:hypothetical protein